MKRPKIFFSAASPDLARARSLAEFLERQVAAEAVFLDFDGGIEAGADWRRLLEERMAESDLVAVLWTESSVRSDWVVHEASFADAQGKLLPVRLDAVEIPRPFAHLEHVDLSGWDGKSADAEELGWLEVAVRSLLGLPEPAGGPPPKRKPAKGRTKKSSASQPPSPATGTAERPPDAPPSEKPASEPPPTPEARTDVPTHTDEPATVVDLLGRRPLARFLAEDLRRIREQNESSYVIHLHGPWGSGKSSLLNFLRHELENPEPGAGGKTGDRRWVVAEFNAWRHERFGAPWWWLLDAVARQAPRGLGWRRPFRAAWVWLTHQAWKRFSGRGFRLIALVVFLAILGWAVLRLPGWLDALGLSGIKEQIALVSSILGLAGAVSGALFWVSRTFTGASAQAVDQMLASSHDPVRYLKDHFEKIVRRTRLPVAVIVDDLDRCRSEYVTELLEGIQTLFRSIQVTFIVAADRRWIHGSYAQVYEGYDGHLTDQGRELGQLFLEKIFQASVPVPVIDDKHRVRYYQRLIGLSAPGPADVERHRVDARKALAGLTDEKAVLGELDKHGGDPGFQQVFLEEVMAKLAAPEVVESTEHALGAFGELLEANPRAMKRFVNTYRVNRALDLTMRRATPPDHLARWTILSLRWPALTRYLAAHPEMLESALEGDEAVPDEFRALLQRADVRAVLGMDGDQPAPSGPLDAEAVDSLAAGFFPYAR